MRKILMGVIVSGIVAIGGLAVAQNAGPSLAPPGAGTIIPVTGPTTVPMLPEPAKATATPPVAQADSMITESPRKSTTSRSAATAPARKAPKTAKSATVAGKPVPKTTAKKAPGTKHVAKATATPKAKQATTVKHQAPTHHAEVGKPIPLTKAQPPSKSAAPVQPVLPRV